MQFHAAGAERERVMAPRPRLSQAGGWQALLLSESRTLLAGPPPLFQGLSARERELVLSHGRRRVLNRGQTLFSQGTTHEGIYLIESGRIRVFYNAPSGREITLAYWYPGTSSVARTSSGPASICGPALPPATAVSFSCRARPCGPW